MFTLGIVLFYSFPVSLLVALFAPATIGMIFEIAGVIGFLLGWFFIAWSGFSKIDS